MVEHTMQLIVDVLMSVIAGNTSSIKLILDVKEFLMFRKYLALAGLAFLSMTSVQAEVLNNTKYEYATVFIPNRGPLFVYSAVSKKGFHEQRVNIQQLDILSDELEVAVPKGIAEDLDKLHSMLKAVGFKQVSHRIVYSGFEKVYSDNELWQDVVRDKKFYTVRKSENLGSTTTMTPLTGIQHQTIRSPREVTVRKQDHKTGQRIDLKKGPEAGHAYVFRRLAMIE